MANKIEENFEKLEQIIQKMQSDEVSLDESFALYQDGIKLVKESNEQIEKIEQEIKVLEGNKE